MDFCKIENGICVNVAVFDNVQAAAELGYLQEIPSGYWIGDHYDGESWSHAPAPEPPPEPESKPDVWDELATAIREGVNEV